jgi:hypothetical protein
MSLAQLISCKTQSQTSQRQISGFDRYFFLSLDDKLSSINKKNTKSNRLHSNIIINSVT